MKRAYKYRFYPTPDQVELLNNTFGCVRFVYNAILQWRTDAYSQRNERIGHSKASAKLTEMKRSPELSWLNNVSSVPLQQALRHQQSSFSSFFTGRGNYPSLKRKGFNQSASFAGESFRYSDGKIYIAKSKSALNVRWSRPLPCSPSTITISKDGCERYFVSCTCEVSREQISVSNRAVGIDLGLTDVVVTDDGFKSGNPKNLSRYAKKLAALQRSLSKKKLGSKNRIKARRKVARVHAKISDCRMDFLHKLSRKVINENQVVCIESLSVKSMIKNPFLSKHISDAGWGEFVRQLHYKAESSGRQVIAIDRFFPSTKRCSSCFHTLKILPLHVRTWICPSCGETHDRDVNAAKNIKAAGLAVLAHGAVVIP